MKEINLANKKVSPIAWVPTLYFAMGMPFVVLNMVLSLLYKDLGIGNAEITFWTGLIMLPWTLKFLWSPLLELYKTKKFFVVLTQVVSGVVFGLAAISLHLPDFFAIYIALFAVVALSGATHDIAADGTYMGVLSKEDQARWIGWQGAFYNIAKIFATGLLVWIAGIITPMVGVLNAWTAILVFLCVVMTALGIYHYFILPTDGKHNDDKKSASETLKELWDVLKEFVQKAHIIYYILFIIIYRLAEGFVMKVVPLFLHDPVSQGGLGLSNEQIGTYYGTFGAAAFVVGSILGGNVIARFGLKRVLFVLALIFNLPFLVYTFLAIYQPSSLWLIGGGIVIEYFGYGFGFVGLTMFMMHQIAPGKNQMSHYAIASGIMNLSVMVTGMSSGKLTTLLGYEGFFLFVLIFIIPALLITWFVPFTYPDKKQ